MNPAVQALLQRPQPVQRSPEWHAMRTQMVTASDWGSVLGENPYSSYKRVLNEKTNPEGKKFTGNAATAWGQKYEPIMNRIYEKRNNVRVIEFGLLQHPEHSFLGASPDGITEDGVMVEIKCPTSREITGEVPRHYWCQVQGQLEVTNLDVCDFIEGKFIQWTNGLDDAEELEANANKSKFGERGCFLQFSNRKTKETETVTSDVYYSDEEMNLWIDEETNRHSSQNQVLMDVEYWRLTLFSCARIDRDREWFVNALIKLRQFWEDVIEVRDQYARGIVPEKIAKKKSSVKIPTAAKFQKINCFFPVESTITKKKENISVQEDDESNEDDDISPNLLIGGFGNKTSKLELTHVIEYTNVKPNKKIHIIDQVLQNENFHSSSTPNPIIYHSVPITSTSKQSQAHPIANSSSKNKKIVRTPFSTPLTSYSFFQSNSVDVEEPNNKKQRQ